MVCWLQLPTSAVAAQNSHRQCIENTGVAVSNKTLFKKQAAAWIWPVLAVC